MDKKTIWIGNDHGGYELKKQILEHLVKKGYAYNDIGTNSTDIVRYPYYAAKVAGAISKRVAEKGILICSTGIGMSIIANKFKGVRASLCTSTYMGKMTRAHNDSNLLCLGGKITSTFEALDIIDIWLSTEYEGGRHNISLDLIKNAEDTLCNLAEWKIKELRRTKMPGYLNWKELYKLEYFQLNEEGYHIETALSPDFKDGTELSEQSWEIEYKKLWSLRDKGYRSDYPYIEPNGYDDIIADASEPPVLAQLDEKRYTEKLRGAWYGRCAGVILGKPVEMGLNRMDIKEYLESVNEYPLNDWLPAYSEKLDKRLNMPNYPSTKGNISYAQPDDDIHYTILALLLVEEKRLDFTTYDVGVNVLNNIPYNWLWSATKQAYCHMINMTSDRPFQDQVDEFPTKYNPMREGINATIRADFWGYICPGDPRKAAKLAHKEASFNSVKNGLYGSMFTAACISTALSMNPTVKTILQGGLSVIPKKSRFAKVISEVLEWYAIEKDWIPVCDKIYKKYGHFPFAGGLNNLAFVVLSLIHGQLDYTKTITTAVMCGTDTDCNSGTAASIVGAAIGYDKIDQRWIAPLNDRVKTVVAGFGEGRISELVKRTIEVYKKIK